MKKEKEVWKNVVNTLSDDLQKLFYKEWTGVFMVCSKCGVKYPQHRLFFICRNSGKNYYTYCKTCSPDGNKSFIIKKIAYLFDVPCGYKYCNDCGRILPHDIEHFRVNGSRCKECLGSKFGIGVNQGNIMLRKTGRKKCRICQEIKPIADFKKYKSRYAEFCLACEPVYAKKKQEYDKEFYKNNKESLQKYYEEWRENGGREIRNISEGKRRSLKNALLSDLTIDEWKDTLDYFGNSCAYCGISEEQHKATHCTNLHKDQDRKSVV